MKRWLLFLLLSLLLHGILLLLPCLFLFRPHVKPVRASMSVRLVSSPGNEKGEERAQPDLVSGSPAETDSTENVPETDSAVPATEKSQPVPPEPVQDLNVPEPPQDMPATVSRQKPEPVIKPKPAMRPAPEPENEPKPKPKPQPKQKPKPETKPAETRPVPKSAVEKQEPAIPPTEPAKSGDGPARHQTDHPDPVGAQAVNSTGTAGPRETSGSTVREIGEGDLVKKVIPRYPVVSRRRGEEGKVVFIVTVRKGQVREIKMETGSGFSRLDESARRALKAWTFRGDLDGLFRIPVVFRLD